MSTFETITRRKLLKAATVAATGVAMPVVWTKRARAAEEITVADVGGATAPALRAGFYDPFEKETGIRVINVAHESDPVTQFKLVVDTGSKIWDVCMVTPDDVARLTADKNYLESLDIAPSEDQDLIPGALKPNWLGFSVYAIVMAYRSDVYKTEAPKSWADFWKTTKFPGRRGNCRKPTLVRRPTSITIAASRNWRSGESSISCSSPIRRPRVLKIFGSGAGRPCS